MPLKVYFVRGPSYPSFFFSPSVFLFFYPLTIRRWWTQGNPNTMHFYKFFSFGNDCFQAIFLSNGNWPTQKSKTHCPVFEGFLKSGAQNSFSLPLPAHKIRKCWILILAHHQDLPSPLKRSVYCVLQGLSSLMFTGLFTILSSSSIFHICIPKFII